MRDSSLQSSEDMVKRLALLDRDGGKKVGDPPVVLGLHQLELSPAPRRQAHRVDTPVVAQRATHDESFGDELVRQSGDVSTRDLPVGD